MDRRLRKSLISTINQGISSKEDLQWKVCGGQVGVPACGRGSAKVVCAKNARIAVIERVENFIVRIFFLRPVLENFPQFCRLFLYWFSYSMSGSIRYSAHKSIRTYYIGIWAFKTFIKTFESLWAFIDAQSKFIGFKTDSYWIYAQKVLLQQQLGVIFQ